MAADNGAVVVFDHVRLAFDDKVVLKEENFSPVPALYRLKSGDEAIIRISVIFCTQV